MAWPLVLGWLAGGATLCLGVSGVAQPPDTQTAVVLVTADRAGVLQPCAQCPREAALGGIARAAALVRAERGKGPALLLDAGNAFFGSAGVGGEPGVTVRDAYDAMGYDAVNIGYRDFRFGRDTTLELLAEAAFAPVSANLKDASGGLLFEPFVVRESGGKRVAVLGLTARPPGLDALPHLRRQLAGVEIADPVACLGRTLPLAKKDADAVVLLFYGDRVELTRILAAFEPELDAVLVGGMRPGQVPESAALPLGACEGKGREVTRLELAPDAVPEFLAIGPDLTPEPEVRALLQRASSFTEPKPVGLGQPLLADEPLEIGATKRVSLTSSEPGFGKGLVLHVFSLARRDVWQGLEPPSGTSWLVLDLAVENDIPGSLAYGGGRDAREKLLVALKQRLLLLCGEEAWTVVRAAMIRKPTDERALLPRSFVLDFIGDSRRGEAAFAVDDAAFDGGPLELRLYHPEVQAAHLTLRGGLGPDEVQAAQGNGYLEFALPTVRFPETVEGRVAPPGTRWISVRLVGRSVRRLPVEGHGESAAQPMPTPYLKSDSHLEVLVDGLWARRAEPGLGSFGTEPMFLPDRFTGGTAVFSAPLEAHSIEVSLAFPTFALEDSEQVEPETILFLIEEDGARGEDPEPLLSIADGPLGIEFLDVTRSESVGAFRAGDGRMLLRLDGIVEGREEGGLFEVGSRFSVPGAKFLGTLGRDERRLEEPFLVPRGGRRAFRVLFDVPNGGAGPMQVSYNGVVGRRSFTIAEPGPVAVRDEPRPRTASRSEEVEGADARPEDPASLWTTHRVRAREPDRLEAIGPLAVAPTTVEGDGLSLTLKGASFSDSFGGREAGGNEVWLEAEVELAVDGDAEPLHVTALSNALFGVADDRKAFAPYRMRGKEGYLDEVLALEPGGTISGRVGFALPRQELASFSIEFAPEGREVLDLPVIAASIPAPSPFATRTNRVAELELLGFEASAVIDGVSAGRDRVFVVADVRATGRFDGADFPSRVVPWHRFPERVQLVIDGLDSFVPRSGKPTDVAKDPVLFPGPGIGGRLAFDVPRDVLSAANSVELLFGFEETEVPGGGRIQPEPLRFQLAGEQQDVAPPNGLRRIEDVDCTVLVGDLESRERFRQQFAGRGERWIVTELWMLAAPGAGVTIDPRRRFRLVDGHGAGHEFDPQSLPSNSPTRFRDPLWIPPGGVRHMTAAFRVPEGAVGGARLFYRGLLTTGMLPATGGQGPLPIADLPNRSPRGLAGVGLRPGDVQRAIDRGREFLWKQMQARMRGGHLEGAPQDGLALLALLHCDETEFDPGFDRAVHGFLGQVTPETLGTYELGVTAMIVEELADPAYDDLHGRLLASLVEGQGLDGSWGYVPEVPARTFQGETESGIQGFVPGRKGVVRTQSWFANRGGDNSVSQFAVLALAGARERGLLVDSATWRRSLLSYSSRQNLGSKGEVDGGWGYTTGNSYGSMTCAGIVSLAIAMRRIDPTLEPLKDLRVRDGLEWLERNWTLARNPEYRTWHYYYLYGLERVGEILGTEFLGTHEWYPEGARFLVDAQAPDGSWRAGGKESDVRLPTSFALLFLTRATRGLVAEPEPTPSSAQDAIAGAEEDSQDGPGTLQTKINLPRGTPNVYVILDASGSMLSALGGRRKFDIARDALGSLIASLPDDTSFALRAYGHRKRAIEEGASEDTELLVPFAPLERDSLRSLLDRLRPRGKTPLTLSLEEARRDLDDAPENHDTLVLLLTDGGEDTRADPIPAAERWAKLSSIQFWVIGFDIGRPEWTRQLKSIAEAAHGHYTSVDRADELASRVESVTLPNAPAFELLNLSGEVIADGTFGDTLELPPGSFTLRYELHGQVLTTPVTILSGRTATIEIE